MKTANKLLFEAPIDSSTARAKRRLQRSPLYMLTEKAFLARWNRQSAEFRHNNEAPWLRKQQIMRSYAQQFGLKTFIETGTYLGNTTASMAKTFDKVITIELQPTLFKEATARFAKNPNVQVLEGDSGSVLPTVLEELNEPALFWLDGHFSGGGTARADLDTPVWAELEAVLKHHVANHVILIDDARLFGTGDYPSVSDIELIVKEHRPEASVVVDEGICRIATKVK